MDRIANLQTLNNEDASHAERAAAALTLRNAARNDLDSAQTMLTRAQGTLKGMETSVSRGHYITPTKIDAKRHDVSSIEDLVARLRKNRDEYQAAYELHRDLDKEAKHAKVEDWVGGIIAAYEDYHVVSWNSGIELRAVIDERRVEVTIYLPRQMWRDRQVEPAKVNFSALGSVSPEFARGYAKMIQDAAAIAEQANADGIVVD